MDEEPATCEILQTVLRSTGLEFVTLGSIVEARNLLNEGRFSLVFLDQQMTSPDGHELTIQIRSTGFNRTTPIIMISADQRPSALTRGFQAGASFFLFKPIDKNRLLKLVRATQGNMEHERRRIRRVPLRIKALLKNGVQEIEGETLDVSTEGVLVYSPKTFPVGSFLKIRLDLPQNLRPIECTGCVVRLPNANQMGIHIGRLPVAESERLQELLLPIILQLDA